MMATRSLFLQSMNLASYAIVIKHFGLGRSAKFTCSVNHLTPFPLDCSRNRVNSKSLCFTTMRISSYDVSV